MSTTDPALHLPAVVSRTAAEAGASAGRAAADVIARVLGERDRARVIFASAPSQEHMLATLGVDPRIDWSRVDSFHMDDYLGLDRSHPAAFGTWLTDRLPAAALPTFDRIRVDGEAEAEIARYTARLTEAPIDLVCLGVGVNGHIAFNEPGDTDFDTAELVRLIELAHTSRQQQVDEGLFPDLGDVPTRALTLTVPALVSARSLVCTVIGSAKSRAVADTLAGPVTAQVPATALRGHSDAVLHCDTDAASLLPEVA
jgi:glucosamine-6-phosphate deaminase